ncbi:sulfate ABC transporter permease subunit CysT [Sphingomonas sp. SM33]|jgi:sulfate transport system permease protein|uniref:Sulfate transport system permease protein CysT n=1 Tax=Sphingomonas telluris TaxID=2907998 RepID=A0ABS9VNI1_9SPHN|nr:sulfate ABC transporter permease subunit CysT [Sphingomonas telluris]MCH8616054.1 sulfate ABC transporter permease subunit CysT [Sphingomonas telluris]
MPQSAVVPAFPKLSRSSSLPGLSLSLGITAFWLSFIVLIPLAAVFARSASGGWGEFADAAFSARALASYRVTFGAALLAAGINAFFGLLVAWVLVRYDFPFKRLFGALVDLPFALPTAVAGIALTALYADTGLIGRHLEPMGLPIAYHPAGIVVALTFIGLPFIVRTVEPVLAEVSREAEEAALTLGASRLQTFTRVILPTLFPALATGFTLAFARGAGEYGSVIFIAGNMPFRSEISALLIITQLEQYNYVGAAAIATVMLFVSFAMLLILNLLQHWQQRRRGS